MIYYVYSRKTGRLVDKTTKIEDLHKYIPNWYQVVIY